MRAENPDDHTDALPQRFDVSVILEQRPSASPWEEHHWEVIGVTAGTGDAEVTQEPICIFEHGDLQRYKISGFQVELHTDECESYYFNLISERPRCFVIANQEGGERPIPSRVSLSFDEAHAYLEGEESLFAVDIPPELYSWSEQYVLSHYVPERRVKRKLQNWRESGEGRVR